MWYNAGALNIKHQEKTLPKCCICGAELILIEEVSIATGNSLYPMTKTTYRCSDPQCQDETNKKVAKKLEAIKERELLKTNRTKVNIRIAKNPE